jgi:hypothetical protein
MNVGQVLKQLRPSPHRPDSHGRRMPRKSKRLTGYKHSISSNTRVYIEKPEDAWIITSFFNIKIDYKFLKDSLVENLFENATFNFFLNQNNDYLFTDTSELIEHDFGKLHPISAIEALKKFGLKQLEEVKEKSYIRL